MTTISDNAMKVLVAAYGNMLDCTAGQFGYSDEVYVEGISDRQKAGYFSDLNKKGLIISWNDEDEDDTQITPTEEGVSLLQAAGHFADDWFEV